MYVQMDETITIDKLVFGGQGLGRTASGKVVFAWNALPGEQVRITPIKKKKSLIDAIATEIVVAAPERVVPMEDHHLVCSPWQIVSWKAENLWKTEIVQETFQSIGGITLDQQPLLFALEHQTHYRNKMEYSFTWSPDEKDELSLAFVNRGGRGFAYLPEGCCLAEPGINETALAVATWLRKHEFFVLKTKSLIVRSNGSGQTIAALFIKDLFDFPDLPDFGPECLGFEVYFSDPLSPAAKPTELLKTFGQNTLTSMIQGTQLQFGLHSFFQVNIPLFEQALSVIQSFVTPNVPLLDFYSGVGAIGLPLATLTNELTLVDSNAEAIAFAKENIQANGITNANAICAEAEKITDLIQENQTLIVDPPRAGMHGDVVERILDVTPERVIYLSCNLSTQARDVALLAEKYDILFFQPFNFFPRTPHIESLCVLERR